MTTNRDRGALRAASLTAGPLALRPLAAGLMGRPTRLSRRFCLHRPRQFRRNPPGAAQASCAVRPYPGLRPACTVTPYREDRCLLMPRYAQPGRS
jgi:hypothetical protein